jgi:hypothetical protein
MALYDVTPSAVTPHTDPLAVVTVVPALQAVAEESFSEAAYALPATVSARARLPAATEAVTRRDMKRDLAIINNSHLPRGSAAERDRSLIGRESGCGRSVFGIPLTRAYS